MTLFVSLQLFSLIHTTLWNFLFLPWPAHEIPCLSVWYTGSLLQRKIIKSCGLKMCCEMTNIFLYLSYIYFHREENSRNSSIYVGICCDIFATVWTENCRALCYFVLTCKTYLEFSNLCSFSLNCCLLVIASIVICL